MTWTRLDDTWTDKPQLESLDFAARWHYLCMIQFCCRNGRYDGVIRHVDARRASDHPDTARALSDLTTAGLISIEGSAYRLVDITDHVPPPHVIRSAEGAKVRKRRERAHKNDDHSLCLEGRCINVTGNVTRDTGTGRDRTGQAVNDPVIHNVIDWPVVTPGQGNKGLA